MVQVLWDEFGCFDLSAAFDNSVLGDHTSLSYDYTVTMESQGSSLSTTMQGARPPPPPKKKNKQKKRQKNENTNKKNRLNGV